MQLFSLTSRSRPSEGPAGSGKGQALASLQDALLTFLAATTPRATRMAMRSSFFILQP